jgi:hypothetical protein
VASQKAGCSGDEGPFHLGGRAVGSERDAGMTLDRSIVATLPRHSTPRVGTDANLPNPVDTCMSIILSESFVDVGSHEALHECLRRAQR